MGMKIAVVGAGISGLSLAYRLNKEGNDVTVFESAGKVGGKIGTVYCEGLDLDLGPISIAETPALKELVSELGLEIIEATDATKLRYVYSKGKLHKASPFGSLLSPGGKISMWKSLFTSKGEKDESVASYATRRFGKQAYQRLFNPLMNGIYAGNAELLSARSVIKNRAPRKIVSIKGGVAALTGALAARLCVSLNSSFDDFNSFDQTYLTTPAYVTAELIKKFDVPLSEKLSNIRYSSLSQIFVETVPGKIKFDGFGFLVPSEERMSLLGAVCVSNIFPSKVSEGRSLFVLFCGGDRPYEFKATVEGAVNEFKNILQPALAKVIHVEEYVKGIPQFYIGHQEIVGRIEDFELRNPKIRIRGNYISGVAVGDCI
jgi:oxygen-dependent protoporphyrinogen oxidase